MPDEQTAEVTDTAAQPKGPTEEPAKSVVS